MKTLRLLAKKDREISKLKKVVIKLSASVERLEKQLSEEQHRNTS